MSGDAQQVLEADARWLAAFNRGDADALVEIYAPDVVVMPPDRSDLHGRAAVAGWMREFFSENRACQRLVHDEVLAEGPWALLRGRFELAVTSRATGRTTELRGKHLVVWRRSASGEWLAFRDIWSVG